MKERSSEVCVAYIPFSHVTVAYSRQEVGCHLTVTQMPTVWLQAELCSSSIFPTLQPKRGFAILLKMSLMRNTG